MTRPLSKINRRDRCLIEQQIARGTSPKKIMDLWDITYETFTELKLEMLTGERRVKAAPKAAALDELPLDFTRPIESYYGPADPSVIEQLIGEMFGEFDRRKARRVAA